MWNTDTKMQYGRYNQKDATVTILIMNNRNDFFFVPQASDEHIPYDAKTMSISAPVPGFNTALADKATEAGKLESAFLAKHHLDGKRMKKFKEWKVFGLRRAIHVLPTNTKIQYKGDDLMIDFTLPSGSYASIVFDKLTEILE